jgi:CheY-like chemotaxis protein
MKALRILIVEDYRDTADLLALWATSEGHEVCVCYTAFQAEQAMPEFRPDIALLDIGLPDMDGWELAPLLRRQNPQLKIFAVTAYQSPEDQQKSQHAGIDLHLAKPLTRDRIMSVLAAAAAE